MFSFPKFLFHFVSFAKVYTQIKICEPLNSIRNCRKPTDWTLLALQSERTGKAHYVAVCRCPKNAKLEGPYTHNQPPYARIAGIRVYGMLCTQLNREFRRGKQNKDTKSNWPEVFEKVLLHFFAWTITIVSKNHSFSFNLKRSAILKSFKKIEDRKR